jgi:hypothetical protein
MQQALEFEPAKLNRPAVLEAIARQQGVRAVRAVHAGEAKARRVDPAFVDRASAVMLAYLQAHGTSSGELLTDACKVAGIKPPDDRHFGAVTKRLIGRGLIHWAGPCKRLKGHASRGGSLYALGGAP